jgi:hypothetical protein
MSLWQRRTKRALGDPKPNDEYGKNIKATPFKD